MEYPFRSGSWKGEQRSTAEQIWQAFEADRSQALASARAQLLQDDRFDNPVVQNPGQNVGVLAFPTRPDLNDFVMDYACPVGRSLAGLAGIKSEWQLKLIDELARGVYITRRIVFFRTEVINRMIFIPLDELAGGLSAEGASIRSSPGGNATETLVSKIEHRLWKESVRAKDHFAAGVPIVRDLSRRHRVAIKKMVLEHLEYLRLAEKSGWDLTSEDMQLSLYLRAQIAIQSRFGRATFKY